MPELKTNVLYYGDNLDILRNHIPDKPVDVAYLRPACFRNCRNEVIWRDESEIGHDLLRNFLET